MTIQSVLIQKLLQTNAHLGRQRAAPDHFKVFAHGRRNGMTIIDSDKTLICLRTACDFIGNLVRQKAKFLFVNTNPLYDEIVDQMTKKIGLGSSSKSQYWRLCGFLTNSSSPKKFKSRSKKIVFGPVQAPDCVVIMDTEGKSTVIKEASRLQIPIIGLVDSNMSLETFKKITYPIPCNDSVQFVYLFCNLITKTFLFEQKRMGVILPPEDNLDLLLTPTSDELDKDNDEADDSEIFPPEENVDVLVSPTSDELVKQDSQAGDSVISPPEENVDLSVSPTSDEVVKDDSQADDSVETKLEDKPSTKED